MKKILVAGAGHGGLIVAANLAKRGFNVTVIEQKRRSDLGYDWTDIFDINSFISAGVPIKKSMHFEYKDDMTFYTPTLKFSKKPTIPLREKEVKMERKQIYDILIRFAIRNGVKMVYNTKIERAICDNNRVVGIKTTECDYYADLVIDACGINSKVRCTLPKKFKIEGKIDMDKQFYVYRAFYNCLKNKENDEKYKVYLMPRNSRGICWVATENNYVDILIGRFYPINKKGIDSELSWLRENNFIGSKILRGGQIERIPIRRPLSQIVYNGYAAIGDSAFMTIPLMGSGLAMCAKAAKILTEVIIKKQDTDYGIEDLWDYQALFYRKIGYDLAYKDVLKELFINMDPNDIDVIFKNNIINDEILLDITNGKKLELTIKDIIKQGKNGVFHPKILLELSNALLKAKKISNLCKRIPKEYSYLEVEEWKEKYMNIKDIKTFS